MDSHARDTTGRRDRVSSFFTPPPPATEENMALLWALLTGQPVPEDGRKQVRKWLKGLRATEEARTSIRVALAVSRLAEEQQAMRNQLDQVLNKVRNVRVLAEDPAQEPQAEQALVQAQRRGEALLAQWLREGVLVLSRQLAQAWAITPQALRQAAERGEVPCVFVANKRVYPAELLDLTRSQVAQVHKALQGVDPVEAFTFWMRKQGSLKGLTVARALEAGMLEKVLRIAQGWARERTQTDAASAS